jgi:hypothetical protein
MADIETISGLFKKYQRKMAIVICQGVSNAQSFDMMICGREPEGKNVFVVPVQCKNYNKRWTL